MPRQPRFVLPGTALHVVQRGNNRAPCFQDDGDAHAYLLYLRELTEPLDCALHAYCLMTNHVHLLLTPGSSEACVALMRNLGQRYAQHFNRKYARTGTLWEGRYRSCIAESAAYVLACYRYIELNPVRAGMVPHPEGYRWSSYRANALGMPSRLVRPHPEFIALGTDAAARRAAYAALVKDGLEQPLLERIRASTNAGYPLVSESLKAIIDTAGGARLEPGRPGRRPAPRAARKSGPDPDLEFGL
jgi:putative transposase